MRHFILLLPLLLSGCLTDSLAFFKDCTKGTYLEQAECYVDKNGSEELREAREENQKMRIDKFLRNPPQAKNLKND